ncbi:GyrI-like domain-containing protein [Cerasicoccus frondis]|uniref:GyrI-like domain-containing protein n=1 Tax=Cerasicoccus frondis TaxID=490090 RepID=UPI0028527107|nr:GyrI-like domain-containing protein [Cerasicoccus frondis]
MIKPKHEWRRHEKEIYCPKQIPSLIKAPAFKFIRIRGEGDPNKEPFNERIRALYPIAYGIKMIAKKPEMAPKGHYDFTVYPLEGVWDISDEAKKNFSGKINKDDLVYELMLRQPAFVTRDYFLRILDISKQKIPNPLFDEVELTEIEEGLCLQMLHVGPFDTEAETFKIMEAYATNQGLTRQSKLHREIYLSDFRKTAPEKLKTVLRFKVK